MRQGWDPRYKIWVEHGEPAPPTPPPVIDNTRQPQMSDMTALLNDLSYIPPNNEHNEPTQGDIGETSNEPTQATRNEFEELYASANEELYPGCDYVTRLDFMAKFTYFKAKGRLTDSIFNEMLEFFQNVFPISKGFKLPPSYYAIKKTFKMIGLGYESIHACEHDCCLFRGDNNKDLDFCPVCNTSRWKDSNTPGKKVPKKVLRYFPIIPRLQRLYKSSHTAKDMIWHATGKCTEPGKMQHPVDGGAWKKFDTKYPNFAKEPRNVRLGLAADGFNPFGNLSQAYSMWPVILTTYNLPVTFRIFRYMKKLKGYVRNKAKPEGSIAEGYVAEEALTFSSHYFRDVTTKFNRPDRNVDPPPSTCRFQVFRSVCKPIGLRSFIRFDAQELKKVKWYVLHNSPEIQTRTFGQFKSLFPNKDMQEEFPDWFGSQIRQRHVDNDQDLEVSTTSELFALANGPSWLLVVEHVNHKKFPDGGVIVVEDDPDIIHFDNSSDLPLSTSLNDLDNVTLHIDGQSTMVDAPPNIIDVPDEDDDIIGDEDALPYDLADSDVEDLINVDDDGVEVVYSSEEED
ncbi:hypothetical protein Tco_0213688 [Tanacetum coccineum]